MCVFSQNIKCQIIQLQTYMYPGCFTHKCLHSTWYCRIQGDVYLCFCSSDSLEILQRIIFQQCISNITFHTIFKTNNIASSLHHDQLPYIHIDIHVVANKTLIQYTIASFPRGQNNYKYMYNKLLNLTITLLFTVVNP